jgi:hypothetical protein
MFSVMVGRVLEATFSNRPPSTSSAPKADCPCFQYTFQYNNNGITLSSPDKRIVSTEFKKSITDMELNNLFNDSRAASNMSSGFASGEFTRGPAAKVISCATTSLIAPLSLAAEKTVFGFNANPTNMISAWARRFPIIDGERE